MQQIPTVKVVHEGGYMVINEADYDPAVHKLFKGQAAPPAQPAGKTGETGGDAEEQARLDAEVHGTPVNEAIAKIKAIPTLEGARLVREREARNPKHPGGRASVMKAAAARITDLEAQ